MREGMAPLELVVGERLVPLVLGRLEPLVRLDLLEGGGHPLEVLGDAGEAKLDKALEASHGWELGSWSTGGLGVLATWSCWRTGAGALKNGDGTTNLECGGGWSVCELGPSWVHGTPKVWYCLRI